MANVADWGYTPDFINQYMQAYSELLHLPSAYFQSIAQVETGYDPTEGDYSPGPYGKGCNSIGACGMMQLLPIAVSDCQQRFSGARTLNKFDPFHAVILAAMYTYLNQAYFVHFIGRIPQWDAQVAAYNGGIGAGLRYVKNGSLVAETANYINMMYQLMGS